jgi:hypothetical protein
MPTELPRGFYINLPTPSGVQRWRVAYRRQSYAGCVEWRSRTIWLKPNQTPAQLADTLIHEAGHVGTGFGDGQEPTVEATLERVAAGATALLLKARLLVTEDEE